MNTVDSITAAFAPAHQAIDWANAAIDEFNSAAAKFFEGDITKNVIDFDQSTGEKVAKVILVVPLPTDLARKATEALNNARHSFDQAMFSARKALTGKSKESVGYPWANSPTDLENRLKNKKIDQRLWNTLKAHESYPRSNSAYPGGDDLIRTLATIANKKHTVGLSIGATFNVRKMPTVHGGFTKKIRIMVPVWNPEKNEAEFVRWIGDAMVYPDYSAAFQVTFKDSRFAQPVNVVRGLKSFSDKAKAVTDSLQAQCIEILIPP